MPTPSTKWDEAFWRERLKDCLRRSLEYHRKQDAALNERFAKERREALLSDVPDGVWPLSTQEGALAHVVKRWGCWLPQYAGVGVLAVSAALSLAEMRDRCARLSTRDREIAMTVRRKHGREIIFQQALYEAAQLDRHLAGVITPNTAMLLCVSEGVMAPPRDEEQRLVYEKRWCGRV